MRADLEFIKQRLSIVDVANRLGLNPTKGRMRCLHPQRHSHGDRTPSVSLNDSLGRFTCWVCTDVRGDVFELVMQARGITFKEALRWIEEQYPWTREARQNGATEKVASLETPVKPMQEVKIQSTSIVPPPLPSRAQQVHLVQREEHWREKALLRFLKLLVPLDHPSTINSEVRRWLISRKIFLKTWTSMRLRWIEDYGQVNDMLQKDADKSIFQEIGLLNEHGNLRFYKHRLILPYMDAQNHPLHFQARATDSQTTPKELSLKGTIPCPYNSKALDKKPGLIYLCEGPIDTLTLIDKGIPAVGVPGVSHLKEEWIPLFENKKIMVCFDNDVAGRQASQKVCELFAKYGYEASPLKILPDGTDINDWFVRT